ncbi:MAG: hypothetical protein DIU60_020540, partial [Actinomycetes bacterium]
GVIAMAYVTLEEASTYFAARLHTAAWDNAGDEERQKALEMASRAIDRLPLVGRPTDLAQGRAFPRHPDTEVPQAVKDACCEEALALLDRGDSERRRLQAEGVVSVTIGSLSETYRTASSWYGLLSQEARELLRPWLLGAVPIR